MWSGPVVSSRLPLPSRAVAAWQREEFAKVALRVRLFVVPAPHRTRAAPAGDLLDGTESRFLAVQIERYVQSICLRAEGHCAPALESGSAGTLIHFDAELRDLTR